MKRRPPKWSAPRSSSSRRCWTVAWRARSANRSSNTWTGAKPATRSLPRPCASSEEEAESGRLIEHPATRRRFTWAAASLAAAAVLALIVALPLWYLQRSEAPGDFAAYRLADRLVVGSEATALMNHTYSGDGWSRTRGFGTGLNERQRSFRLGVRTIDLEIALRASDGKKAERLLHELSDMASYLPLPEMILISYDDLLERLGLGEAPESLVERSTASSGAGR